MYATGGLGGPDAVSGVSDIDLTVVVPTVPCPPGEARNAMKSRWERLCRIVPRFASWSSWPSTKRMSCSGRRPILRACARAGELSDAGRRCFGRARFVDPASVAARRYLSRPPAPGAVSPASVGSHGPPTGSRSAGDDRLARAAALVALRLWRCRRAERSPHALPVREAGVRAGADLALARPPRADVQPATGPGARRCGVARGERRSSSARWRCAAALTQTPDPPLAEMLEGFLRLTHRIADGWRRRPSRPVSRRFA